MINATPLAVPLLLAGVSGVVAGGLLAAGRRTLAAALVLQASAAAAVGVAGFALLLTEGTAGAPFTDTLQFRLGVDGLSAMFLGTLGLIAAPALVFAVRYLSRDRASRITGVLTAAFLLALILVLTARDPVAFLAGWELMTLLPGAIILVARRGDRAARNAVFVYLAITHLGGVGTWVAILLLAQHGALSGRAGLGTGTGLQLAIAVAALVGMGTKAGLMPLHAWLPRAHPIAPAPISALMSGVMIKVAVYGLIRVLVDWVGVLPLWFAVVVLAAGAFSALGGVVYALFQHELKQLLALHSVENIGIIVLGIGACLMLRARGATEWAAFALAAALLHTVNHAVFKALLFLGAGAFERAAGPLELDRLGGLMRRMPWTGGAFLVGAAAIAGLPPLNGFASEWLTMQALLRLPMFGQVGDGTAGAVALAALAATAGLAVMCFVKVVGLVLLGPQRRHEPVVEAPAPMAGAVVFLAVACVVLGAAPGLLFGALVGLAPWARTGGISVGIWLPGTGALPSASLAGLLFGLVLLLMLLRGRRRAASAPTWVCGQPVEPVLGWTSSGFTKPVRLVLEAVLRPERDIAVRLQRGVVQEVTYRGHVPHLIDERIYRPTAHRAMWLAGYARRLQSGSLGTYAAYLIALVILLLGAARLGLFG
ncbi:MAG: proton-conducting transporter membrane subunit [Micromonosporaceae bacterium]